MGSTRATFGASDAAEFVRRSYQVGLSHLQGAYLFGHARTVGELWDVWETVKRPDWDGNGADPVELETVSIAEEFVLALPLGQPMPSIGAEADGSLTFDWYRTPYRTLSVSINNEGQ